MKKKIRFVGNLPTRKYKGLDPQYLTENNLWDSSWLMEKYPERFNTEDL